MSIPSSQRRLWTKEEDQILTKLVQKHTQQNPQKLLKWAEIADELNNWLYKDPIFYRNTKQCRQRWNNCLQPGLKQRQTWTISETKKLFQLYQQYGHKWSKISNLLYGRSENSVKNYFYSAVRKTVRKINRIIAKFNQQIKSTIKLNKVNNQNIEITKILKQLSNESITKLLILAQQKQQYKFQVRNDLNYDHLHQLKQIFLQYMLNGLKIDQQKLISQGSQDSSIQGKQGQVSKEFSYKQISYFLKSINDLNKSCKRKKYRNFALGSLTQQQSEKILKEKKKTDHMREKIVKQQLKNTGFRIIPKSKKMKQIFKELQKKQQNQNSQNEAQNFLSSIAKFENKYASNKQKPQNYSSIPYSQIKKRGRPRKQQIQKIQINQQNIDQQINIQYQKKKKIKVNIINPNYQYSNSFREDLPFNTTQPKFGNSNIQPKFNQNFTNKTYLNQFINYISPHQAFNHNNNNYLYCSQAYYYNKSSYDINQNKYLSNSNPNYTKQLQISSSPHKKVVEKTSNQQSFINKIPIYKSQKNTAQVQNINENALKRKKKILIESGELFPSSKEEIFHRPIIKLLQSTEIKNSNGELINNRQNKLNTIEQQSHVKEQFIQKKQIIQAKNDFNPNIYNIFQGITINYNQNGGILQFENELNQSNKYKYQNQKIIKGENLQTIQNQNTPQQNNHHLSFLQRIPIVSDTQRKQSNPVIINPYYYQSNYAPLECSRQLSNSAIFAPLQMFDSMNPAFFQSGFFNQQRQFMVNSLGESLFFRSAEYQNNNIKNTNVQKDIIKLNSSKDMIKSFSYEKINSQKSLKPASHHPSRCNSQNKSIRSIYSEDRKSKQSKSKQSRFINKLGNSMEMNYKKQ